MRSLSTNALGQPNETIPMVGWFALRLSAIFAFARSGRRFGGFVLMASLTLHKTDWKDHISAEFCRKRVARLLLAPIFRRWVYLIYKGEGN
jgi:hypothetical protein